MLVAIAATLMFVLLLFTKVRNLFARNVGATIAGVIGLWIGAFLCEFVAHSGLSPAQYWVPPLFGAAAHGTVRWLVR